jgi:putative phosphoesterase
MESIRVKIGIISDTHGNVDAWNTAMQLLTGAEIILHAGDVLYHPPRMGCAEGYNIPELADRINESAVPIVIARGNCDAEVYEELLQIPVLSPYAFVQHAGIRIVVQHGHTLTPQSMQSLAEKYKADIFVTGHTHIPVIERMGSALHVNPGSPSISKLMKNGAPLPTVGMIEDGTVRILGLDGSEVLSMPIEASK